MSYFSLIYQDSNGEDHTVTIEATSGTHAISIALEQYEELRLHPNRITRVHKEAKE